jgi:Xaa-Pro aminopeptidase
MLNEKRASSLMNKYSVDYLVASTLENVYYTTGFKSFLKQVTPSTLVFGVHSLENAHDPSLVTSYSEADIVATSSELRARNVGLYGNFPLVLSEVNLKEIDMH